ncbi:MAG TPA: hypothetical protein VMN39_10785 [Longimicrobiaceae bacterium]|nr:hypothetical protein [Longimicrobiaceae bacterium]
MRARLPLARGANQRWTRIALALTGLAIVGASEAAAQRVVPVHLEPRHRQIRIEDDLKLLDVQIQPGDTTLHHTHAEPIMYTFISSGDGPSGGRVSSNTNYATESYTHWVTNAGPNLFRIIALAHYGPAVDNATDRRPEGLAGEPQLENPWFRSYRLELGPGEQTGLIRHTNPAVIIQVTTGHTDVSNEEAHGADLVRMGDWTWREAGTGYRIRNAGSTPVSVVVNEGRRRD